MSAVRLIRKTTIWDLVAERYTRLGLPVTAQMFRNEAWREQQTRDKYDDIAAEALLQHEAAKEGTAMKGKKGKIDVGKLVRGIARERIGQPKKSQVVPDKRRKRLDEIKEREAKEEASLRDNRAR